MLIICSECGKEYSDQAKSCPHCGAITSRNKYISNNSESNYKQWKNKHPFLAWSIAIIAIVVGIWLMHQAFEGSAKNAAYNAGYKSVYQK